MIRGAVSPDHVHMLVTAPPQLAPSKLVQYLNRRGDRTSLETIGAICGHAATVRVQEETEIH